MWAAEAGGEVERVGEADLGGDRRDRAGGEFEQAAGGVDAAAFDELLRGDAELGAEEMGEAGDRQVAARARTARSRSARQVAVDVLDGAEQAVVDLGGLRVLGVAPEQRGFEGVDAEQFALRQDAVLVADRRRPGRRAIRSTAVLGLG